MSCVWVNSFCCELEGSGSGVNMLGLPTLAAWVIWFGSIWNQQGFLWGGVVGWVVGVWFGFVGELRFGFWLG